MTDKTKSEDAQRLAETKERQTARWKLYYAKRPLDLPTVLWDIDYLLSLVDTLRSSLSKANDVGGELFAALYGARPTEEDAQVAQAIADTLIREHISSAEWVGALFLVTFEKRVLLTAITTALSTSYANGVRQGATMVADEAIEGVRALATPSPVPRSKYVCMNPNCVDGIVSMGCTIDGPLLTKNCPECNPPKRDWESNKQNIAPSPQPVEERFLMFCPFCKVNVTPERYAGMSGPMCPKCERKGILQYLPVEEQDSTKGATK